MKSDGTKLKISSALLLSAVLCLGSVAKAQNTESDDVEYTGAFLVKLKPDVTTRAGVEDGWKLTPLMSETTSRGETRPVGGWYYLMPQSGVSTRGPSAIKANWDGAYDLYLGKKSGATRGEETKTPLRNRGVEPNKVEFVEPDLEFYAPAPGTAATAAAATPSASPGVNAIAGSPQTRQWPEFQPVAAYQDDDHSQLKSAREAVEAKIAQTHPALVRIAFLDTGYDNKHVTRPANINHSLARNFAEDKTSPEGSSLDQNPGPPGSQSHGTGTIGILAGGTLNLVAPDGKIIFAGMLGGAPMAEIAPMRVASSVVHLENPFIKTRPSGTTRAILYAIKKECDVISMSHGGLPSRALADAVNAAYEHGIAMFFASGDYLQPTDVSIHSPRYVVFPAAFSRAMSVCGVTADNLTYGKPRHDHYDPALGSMESWRLRGNWGPASWMKNAIAAFSPNILWPHLPGGQEGENIIDLDGQGTSSSTPQAAAAAALWLQYYRDDSALKDNWRNWKKAEMAYAALRQSAKQFNPPGSPNYSSEFFGSGILRAKAALSKSPGTVNIQPQKPASVGLGWAKLFGSLVGGTREPGVSGETIKQMFGLELAQLAQRSVKIQDLMEQYGGYDPDSNQGPSPEEARKFKQELFQAIRDDARTSRHLKDAVTRELERLPNQ
jgi:subtilase family protein